MPLGKSPILQNDLMAEGDNQKYLLFNDALVAIEDAANRALEIDLSSSSRTLSESEVLRYGVFVCAGNTVSRSLSIPSLVGSGTVPTNRQVAVRNNGGTAITVTHNAVGGDDLVVGAGTTALIYADGTDIVSLGGVNNSATIPLSDEGVEVIGGLLSVNFSGNGYTITDDGNGAATITMDVPQIAADLGDVPAYGTNGGKALVVKVDETGLEFVSIPTDGAAIKSLYEGEADTNAYTDAEKSKLAGIEGSKFKGTYSTETALTTAQPAPGPGAYAYVDAGVGSDTQLYIWDADDGRWVSTGSTGSTETSASIKTKYESNADTNAFTDSEKTKLTGIEAGATADQTAAEIETLLDAYYGNTDWRTGGTGGGASISVDGVSVLATPTDLNFTGGVTVVDDGDGTATIDVTGGTASAADIESALDTYYGTPDWRNTYNPSGVGEHTYWRVYRVASDDATFAGFAEVKFNGVTPTGGTPFGSTQFDNTDYSYGVAFDGDPATRWATENGAVSNAFIGYEFASPVGVTAVSLQAASTTDGATNAFTQFIVQYSDDGVNYTDAWAETTASWSASEERTFVAPYASDMGIARVDPAATEAALDAYYGNTYWRTGGSGGTSTPAYRYWGFRVMDSNNNAFNGIAEAEFRDSSGMDLYSGGVVYYSSQIAGFEASLALDNNNATAWSTDKTEDPRPFLGVDLGTVKAVNSIAITSRDDTFFSQAPTVIDILASEDGVTWTTVGTVSNFDSWTQAETRSFLVPSSVTVGSSGVSISEETANYTVVDADLSGNIFKKINVATANTVTVPAGLTGTEPLTFLQGGAGQTTFVSDTGVTINSADGNLKTRVQFSSATLIPDGTDAYYLVGDLAA